MSKKIEIEIPDGYELQKTKEGYKFVKEEMTLGSIIARPSYRENYLNVNLPTGWGSKYKEKIEALGTLISVAHYLNDGWKPDWRMYTESKYFITFNNENGKFTTDTSHYYNAGNVYFKSNKLAKKAIELIGEPVLEKIFI